MPSFLLLIKGGDKMPVLNRINRMLSFPTLYKLNNLQKRNILYNSHIAFEEIDDGIIPINIPIVLGRV